MYGGIIGTINNAILLVSHDSRSRHPFHPQTHAPQAPF